MTVRELNGWSPATVTLDRYGEVVSVTVTEPRFTPGEKALLLASRHASQAPRGSHGVLLSVATDPKNRGRFDVENVVDFAQEALNKVQAEWHEQHRGVMDLDALLWQVKLND